MYVRVYCLVAYIIPADRADLIERAKDDLPELAVEVFTDGDAEIEDMPEGYVPDADDPLWDEIDMLQAKVQP